LGFFASFFGFFHIFFSWREEEKNTHSSLPLSLSSLFSLSLSTSDSRQAGVNPLAGCLPTLVTLPVWIGLYRALSNAADDGLLSEGWFWIPSLAGPTSIAAQKAGAGSAWLFPLIDGAPPIGWEAAIKYLILPVLLTVSQVVSMRIMSPPSVSF